MNNCKPTFAHPSIYNFNLSNIHEKWHITPWVPSGTTHHSCCDLPCHQCVPISWLPPWCSWFDRDKWRWNLTNCQRQRIQWCSTAGENLKAENSGNSHILEPTIHKIIQQGREVFNLSLLLKMHLLLNNASKLYQW